MSTPESPVPLMPDTDIIMSESITSETNLLKRKSHGASPSPNPDANASGDVPNKRPKIRDTPGGSPEPDEHPGRHGIGNGTTENGNQHAQEQAAKGVLSKQESQSPDTRRTEKESDLPSSPEQRRRPSEPRRHDDRSPTGPPDRRTSGKRRESNARSPQGRRGSGSERRMSSLGAEKDRRESFSQEDKKRGRRLFGGILSTLSQTTSNSQQKRRLEIEKRQQERATQQTREDGKRRFEKLAKLERVRKVEQVRFDEQVMRTRHSNMLAMAHSLRTRSEPKLYYRPWELSPEEEDIIKDQVHDAEGQIEEEVKQFKRRKEQRLKDLGALPSSSEVEATVGEQVKERSNNAAPESTTAATATNDRNPSPAPAPAPAPTLSQRSSHHEDRDHDEMVEAEEDTVIY